MLRLIKLALYAGAAYAIYEIVQGMFGEREPQPTRGGRRDLNRALDSNAGRRQTLTGPGLGQRVQTLEPNGGSVPHQVGRGVMVR